MPFKMFYHNADDHVEETDPNMHGIEEDYDDEEEDRLSFCEFSINSDADIWGDSSRESSQNSSSFKSSEEEEYFEFFSQEWSTGSSLSSYPPPENIIFCGKLISRKEPISEGTENVDKLKQRKYKKKKRGILRWKWNFSSSRKTKSPRKNVSKSSTGGDHDQKEVLSQIVPGGYKSLTQPETSSEQRRKTSKKPSKEHNLPVNKMSLFTSSASAKSSRWYMFFFGITKFRTKMELRDMKNRQSRRRSSSFNDNNNISNKSVCINRNNGFWAVLRALSCSGGDHPANVIVKASTASVCH